MKSQPPNIKVSYIVLLVFDVLVGATTPTPPVYKPVKNTNEYKSVECKHHEQMEAECLGLLIN